ncbi:MAG: Cys-tRNA(Pro) deacylase [Thermodesulfobacteriota bacterium]
MKKKTTRATQFLAKQKIPFEVIQYDHEEKGAEFAARATGFPLEKTIKTLVAEVSDQGFVLALMPGDQQLSLKLLARAFSAKRAAMADTSDAERFTGYLVGGISPFATRHAMPAAVEQTIFNHKEVVINAGQRGVMIKMEPKDILHVLKGRAVDLIQR